jgi:ABC-2 type transport system permease protein
LGDIEDFVAGSEFYAMIIGVTDDFSVAQMFSAMVNSIAALTCVVPLLGCVLKLRTEEREGRAEHILTRSVSRVKYLAGFAVPAIAASVLFQLATVFGLYLSAFAVLDEPIPLAFLLEANLVYLPALWVMLGVAILLIGILPRASGVVWAYFAFSFFTEFMGRVLPLPGWLLRLSPFGFTPQLPVDTVRYGVLLAMTGIAAVLAAVGFVFYRRRDAAQ